MKNFTNNFKQFTSHLSARWLIMALIMLVGTSSAWAWGWVVRCTDSQASENPSFYLGDEATFYWCFNGDGSDATYKRTCISTSSSSAGTWEDNVEWIKNGCDGNKNQAWKASFKLTSTGTKYYSLWLGWGKSVGDNGRYYNGSSIWSEGSDKFSSSKFTVNELPNPTDQTHSLSGTTATLTWTKNTTYTTVLVVRYAKGATATQPTGGTSYSTNSAIGNGTVIYKGTDGSCTNTITAGNSYDYYFYTVNNNYYSSGVKTTLEGCTTPVPQITLASNSICAGSTTTLTINEYNANSYSYKLYNGNNVVESPVFNDGVYTLSSAGNYYVTATPISGVCQVESAKQQTATTLTVTSVTLALDPTSAPICSSATIADISTYVTATVTSSEDANVNWYASEDATEELTDNTELKAQFYYAEAVTTSGCKSERKSFEVTSLLNAPSAPVIKSNKYAVCSGESVELTLEYKRVGETYTINDINNTEVFKKSNTWSTPALNSKTDYIVTATNSCGSTNSEKLTINVTTTPVITANKLVTTIDSPITLTSNIDAIWTTTGGILNPNSEETSSVEFTSQNNGTYTITASNNANGITCTATKEVKVQNAFYVYIRRPKSGDNVYNDWYGTTNDAEKGNAPWFKEGTPNYGSMEDTNYGGVGPVESFTDCNDYTWDAFEFAGGYFYIHAPNTGGSNGWATFTKETYIESLSGDVYYYISSFTGGQQGSVLSESATTPERAPEIITPVTSLNPASGILCSGSQATLTVTNPQNDYTYTLMYKGTAQGEPISGNNEVEFTVIEAGSYAVQAKVQSNSGCTSTASSSVSQIKVIATDIKFDATEYTTTPWVPVTVVIEVPSGYEFTYNDATLTSITPEADKPIKKENGHEYTYTFPRPTDWGIGNSQSGDGYDEKPYTITATIKNAEQCGTATATVKLQDEGNDSCTLPNQ